MPMQDVSHDQSMIGWLRQAGHGHLLNEQHQYSNMSSSASSLPIIPAGQSSVDPYCDSQYRSASYSQVANFNNESNDRYQNSRDFISSSPSIPIIPAGRSRVDSYPDAYNRGRSFSPPAHMDNLSYGGQQNFMSTPTQFHAPHMNQYQSDVDIENMRRDPNTRVIQRPPQDDVVYRQRVFVKYLQPPTPPVAGAIIVREKQLPQPPPDPPLVIRRAPPPPPTPPPVVIRERPPPIPPPEGTTIIHKIIPSLPKPPRQVIIEQYPQLPPKPQDVILEKWLPAPPRQRRIFYERLPAPIPNCPTRPIIVQHGQPRVHVQRQIHAVPGVHCPQYQTPCHADLNHVLPSLGANQQICLTAPSSSLVSYNPYSAIEPSYGSICQPQSNVIITQNGCPNTVPSSCYGMPLSCVCSPNPTMGLGAYGCGTSTIPTIGYSSGHSAVYNVPENVPVDHILRQLGVDPCCVQRPSDPHSAVAQVWNTASHVNPPHPIDPHLAVSHVWNAASHVNPPHPIDPHLAVSHVWNAASHAVDHNLLGSSPAGHAWNNIEYHPHPQSPGGIQSLYNNMPY